MDKTAFLAAAEQHCLRLGNKLTTLRRRVLELVLGYDGVVKAYQVLADLQKERGVAAPPTVYRALDFLVENGLLHRVEALNGFIVCEHFDCPHEGLILVCERCGGVTELDATGPMAALRDASAAAGFAVTPQNLVLTGTCQTCQA
ncbi:Fur family transcriptional regulator [Crenobacter cavernae]|uniref:Transcriptional repressor n=1 Tax=Crenobacter cavernae TaxID=2290923 RepID=A0ABY0F9P8_9NEIS|nr:Fur family transcriptional regulator [Crenobacter cavernae]RXZ42198.1 transcriptional repressor [Crenobacter cavernae]